MLTFQTQLTQINSIPVVIMPAEISASLPSRGMVMVTGTLSGIALRTWLEPDGNGSHWFMPTSDLLDTLACSIGDSLDFSIEPLDAWDEPKLPADLERRLTDEHLLELWDTFTPKAHWEWIRWLRFTKSEATRQKRLEATLSKMRAGMKRPCCFDQSRCTIVEVSKNGVLNPPTKP